MNDRGVACLMFGIYEKRNGIIDRRECSVCHGEYCPYTIEQTQHGACPSCFGTGFAPVAVFDLRDSDDSICTHCQGTGRI
jgi:DnaJ-class molecular chaperone